MSESTTRSANDPGPAASRPVRLGRKLLEWAANRNVFVVMGTLFALGLLADRAGLPEPTDNLLFLAAGVVPLALATVSTSKDGYEHEMSNRTRAKVLVSQLGWSITPWGILTQVLQIGGTALAYVRYLGRLPSRDRHLPETRLTAPFDGEWTTVNGGVTKATSHSWGIVAQRYAYDFVMTDEDGDTYEGNRNDPADYHAFGEVIQAPADGTVVKTRDGLRDYPRPGSGWLEWRTWDIPGNHVVIEHETGEYSTLAHLKEGSVSVSPGERVERGDPVGECGNSGMSSEPHLHFQLQDRRNFWLAAGLVPIFEDVTVDRPDDRRSDHEVYGATGVADEGTFLWAGDRVTPGERA